MDHKALVIAALLGALSLAGCVAEDDNDPATPRGPGEVTFEVTAPTSAFQNETFTVNWSFSGGDAGGPGATVDTDTSGNGTSGNASADAGGYGPTGIAWGYQAVRDANSTAAFNNTAGEMPAGAPDTEYSTEIMANEAGTLYLYAYVEIDGEYRFSRAHEVIVGVIEPVIVEIGGGFVGGPAAAYQPAELTIEAGQYIVWRNEDSFAHTATSRSGPEDFDTGEIAPGSESEPIQFTAPGTYTYGCDNHASMAEGTITVNEPAGG